MKALFLFFFLMLAAAGARAQEAPQGAEGGDANLLQKVTENMPGESQTKSEDAEAEEVSTLKNAAELDAWLEEFSGPLTTVIYDKETDTRYIRFESDDEIIEYYDFAHIKDYDDLTYVLMKLLSRIKKDNFRYCSRFTVEYGEFSLPTLVYIRKKNDPTKIIGQLLYPTFKIELSGSTTRDSKHTLDFRNPKMVQNIVFNFVVQVLPEIEEHVGTENFDIERFLGVDIKAGTVQNESKQSGQNQSETKQTETSQTETKQVAPAN